jgi:hypothetical protein
MISNLKKQKNKTIIKPNNRGPVRGGEGMPLSRKRQIHQKTLLAKVGGRRGGGTWPAGRHAPEQILAHACHVPGSVGGTPANKRLGGVQQT